MSEQKEINITQKICDGIWKAQKRLFERKTKLNEPVVVADADGKPTVISASEALERLMKAHPEVV